MFDLWIGDLGEPVSLSNVEESCCVEKFMVVIIVLVSPLFGNMECQNPWAQNVKQFTRVNSNISSVRESTQN